jgi:hypothetical protein
MEASLLQKYMNIAGAVGLYWAISISLVFVNKSLLKGDELTLDAPLFVTLPMRVYSYYVQNFRPCRQEVSKQGFISKHKS